MIKKITFNISGYEYLAFCIYSPYFILYNTSASINPEDFISLCRGSDLEKKIIYEIGIDSIDSIIYFLSSEIKFHADWKNKKFRVTFYYRTDPVYYCILSPDNQLMQYDGNKLIHPFNIVDSVNNINLKKFEGFKYNDFVSRNCVFTSVDAEKIWIDNIDLSKYRRIKIYTFKDAMNLIYDKFIFHFYKCIFPIYLKKASQYVYLFIEENEPDRPIENLPYNIQLLQYLNIQCSLEYYKQKFGLNKEDINYMINTIIKKKKGFEDISVVDVYYNILTGKFLEVTKTKEVQKTSKKYMKTKQKDEVENMEDNTKKLLKINTKRSLEEFVSEILKKYPDYSIDYSQLDDNTNGIEINVGYVKSWIDEWLVLNGYDPKEYVYRQCSTNYCVTLKVVDKLVYLEFYYYNEAYKYLIIDDDDSVIGVLTNNAPDENIPFLFDIKIEKVMSVSPSVTKPSLIIPEFLSRDYNVFTNTKAKDICKAINKMSYDKKYRIRTVDQVNKCIQRESNIKLYRILDKKDPDYRSYIAIENNKNEKFSNIHEDQCGVILSTNVTYENDMDYIRRTFNIDRYAMEKYIFPGLKILLKDQLPDDPILTTCYYDRIKGKEM